MDERIKRWLARAPVPASCVAELGDGTTRRVKITTGRYRWADACRALAGAVRVTALDESGAELRVYEPEDLDEQPDDAPEVPNQPKTEKLGELHEFRAMLAIEVPALVKDIAHSIVEASRVSSEQHAAGYKGAFEALLGVVQAQGKLASSSINDQLKLLRSLQNLQPAAEEGDPNDALAAMLIQQGLGGAAQNGNGNGHAAPTAEGLAGLLSKIDPQILGALVQQLTKPNAPPTGESQ